MNDDEKAFEAFRMTSWLCGVFDDCSPLVVDRFRRGTRFPYFQRTCVTDDKGNRWTLLFYILNKSQKKKGMYYTLAYTTYDIPRKHKEDDVNAGRGCLIFDPFQMKNRIENTGTRTSVIVDIVPHAFNRYTERYLRPLGRGDIEFGYKVEDMLKRWQWFDVCADLFGDKNAEKNKGGNICPYDVIMRGGGMLRGQIVSEVLLRFTTYVSEDMMFENQQERQEAMRSEYFKLKRDGTI